MVITFTLLVTVLLVSTQPIAFKKKKRLDFNQKKKESHGATV